MAIGGAVLAALAPALDDPQPAIPAHRRFSAPYRTSRRRAPFTTGHLGQHGRNGNKAPGMPFKSQAPFADCARRSGQHQHGRRRMDRDRDERIRERAHQIWEREGRQEGSHDAHWQRAERELDEEEQEGLDDTPDAPLQMAGKGQAEVASRRKR
jgi:hypothetical protein